MFPGGLAGTALMLLRVSASITSLFSAYGSVHGQATWHWWALIPLALALCAGVFTRFVAPLIIAIQLLGFHAMGAEPAVVRRLTTGCPRARTHRPRGLFIGCPALWPPPIGLRSPRLTPATFIDRTILWFSVRWMRSNARARTLHAIDFAPSGVNPEGWRYATRRIQCIEIVAGSATGGTHGLRDRRGSFGPRMVRRTGRRRMAHAILRFPRRILAQPRSLLPGCLLLDLQLPDGGLELQAGLAERRELPIIFMTAQTNIPMTVRAMKAGAVDVLTKPFSGDTLSSVIRSALERSRSKLAHAETIESLDVVTASIAFDLKQSLCGIVTNANACLRMLAADPPECESARETVRRTIRDSNRALEVVYWNRDPLWSEGATTESVDLNEATREVLTLLSSELEDTSVIVRIEFAQDLPLVASNRVQLQQAILNLARNALDARRTVNDRPGELLVRSELGRTRCRAPDVHRHGSRSGSQFFLLTA